MMKFSTKMGFSKMTVYNTVADIGLDIPHTSILPLYRDKIIVAEYKIYGKHILRIWRNRAIVGIDRSPAGGDRMIGSMDYSMSKEELKIEFLYVVDIDSYSFEIKPNAKEYTKLMILMAERKAHGFGIHDITMDTHQSLRLYHRYYVEEGFFVTGEVASDNKAWVEMKKRLSRSVNVLN